MIKLSEKENEKRILHITALVNQIEELSVRITKGDNTGNLLSENITYLCRDIKFRLNKDTREFPIF